jgi:serine/threonine-protein kinase
MLTSGSLLAGHYRLVRLLGQGGMGTVWAATNEAIARDVAIKLMLPKAADDPAALQRFFNEARLCGSIRHPGIVDVLDLGRADDGSPFLVMELLEGETLEARLEREGRLLPGVIVPMIRDVARTLALAHAKGIVHRDIKPANLFLHHAPGVAIYPPARPVVKVLDFGISKVVGAGDGAKTTQTGVVIGSPAYMSPEHAVGRVAVDERTDVYALGVVLYETISGRVPFLTENYNTLIVEIATLAPPDIASLVPALPRSIAEVIRAAMAWDRDKRIQTAAELADRLDALSPMLAAADRALLEASNPGSSVPAMSTPGAGSASARTGSVVTTTLPTRASKTPWLSIALGAFLAVALSLGAAALFLPRPTPKPATQPPGPVVEAPRPTVDPGTATSIVAPGGDPGLTAGTPDPVGATPNLQARDPGVSVVSPSKTPRKVKSTKKGKDAWGYE